MSRRPFRRQNASAAVWHHWNWIGHAERTFTQLVNHQERLSSWGDISFRELLSVAFPSVALVGLGSQQGKVRRLHENLGGERHYLNITWGSFEQSREREGKSGNTRSLFHDQLGHQLGDICSHFFMKGFFSCVRFEKKISPALQNSFQTS